jgi:hypothetical protein
LVAIDLDEVRHKPLPAGSPRGHQPVTETLARLRARIAGLEAELAAVQQRSAGHRVDYEHERADRMVAAQDRLVAKLETLRSLLAAIQEAARPRTSWYISIDLISSSKPCQSKSAASAAILHSSVARSAQIRSPLC